ncbi:MAG: Thioredoxin reductase [uncultured Cytophagales bacterium]|uniref:Thioredoxin reductase n=1 Tax=uncultured Cytophagales bacterium TaxID=158755 RepID=A0A6J4IR56_9SPHI|nr:MAG: Thioredoxin reductase [uncultured Cytophagales bacterium]
MADRKDFEVIIIGGSYAGLSAAMALGRSLRNVLIIDSGLPSNRQTPHTHNFITQDGEKPGAIAEKARKEVLQYPTVKFLNDLAVSGRKTEDGFTIVAQSGEQFEARKLIFATGIRDIMPDIKGFADCWGISVVHCPYCHGYELRGKKTGIIANGERAAHLSSLVNNLTDNITLLTAGKADVKPELITKLDRHNVKVVETAIAEIEHHDGHVRNVRFVDGSQMAFQAIYAAVPFAQHSHIPAALGCELTGQGYLKIDGFHQTTLEGVYACGDNANMMRSVANAVYSGNLTGAVVNKVLTDERF